jgi:transcriptional regulator with XRE-family HTH domain
MDTQKTRDFYYMLRRKKKISLTEIAQSIGCSQSLLSMYERGDINMSEPKIECYRRYINDTIKTQTIVLHF